MKHLILLVDASGSMVSHEQETRDAICSIIKGLDKSNHLTLVFFDTGEYKIVANKFVSSINSNIGQIFEADGGTPITDSIYKAIQDVSNGVDDLRRLSEEHRIIIFTDGEENSSHYVENEDLGRAIEHFTENFHWDFQFVGPKTQGAGIKAYAESIKIKGENICLYTDVSEGLAMMKDAALKK